MADHLNLNLWFASFTEAEILPRLLCVLQNFPFASSRPGPTYVGVYSVGWNEPAVFEETFESYASPEHALDLAAGFLHDDNAYVVEAGWELWLPGEQHGLWQEQPVLVKIIAHGTFFEEGAWEESGHIQIELGLDTPFLFEDFELTPLAEQRIKANIEKLVAFALALEKTCGVSHRLLWSESEDNLARKLITRLQRLT